MAFSDGTAPLVLASEEGFLWPLAQKRFGRSACQARVDAEGIHQRHHAQRLEASTSVGADALECRRVSTAVVDECPRERAESRLSG